MHNLHVDFAGVLQSLLREFRYVDKILQDHLQSASISFNKKAQAHRDARVLLSFLCASALIRLVCGNRQRSHFAALDQPFGAIKTIVDAAVHPRD